MGRYFSEELTVQDLKAEGHILVEEIVRLGIPRGNVYGIIRSRLNLTAPKSHFGKMRTKAEVQAALDVLHQYRRTVISRRKKRHPRNLQTGKTQTPKADRLRDVTLPLKDQRAALKQQRKPRTLNQWLKDFFSK